MNEYNKETSVSKDIKIMIKKLKDQGLKENQDFRVVYFNNQAEVKFIKKNKWEHQEPKNNHTI